MTPETTNPVVVVPYLTPLERALSRFATTMGITLAIAFFTGLAEILVKISTGELVGGSAILTAIALLFVHNVADALKHYQRAVQEEETTP